MNERTHKTREDLVEPLTRLFATALKLNNKDFHVFVYGSGHIAEVKITAYAGGWVAGADVTHTWHINLDDEYQTVDEVNQIEQELIKAAEESQNWEAERKRAIEKRERAEYERLQRKYAQA